MEKIYIIDAVNFIFRSYFAIGPMTNPQGESTGGLFGFIRSLNKIIKDFSPTHLVAVFDGPDNKLARTKIYSGYKEHRQKMPADLLTQLHRALEYCALAGIPLLILPGVKADDTMGSIAKWAGKSGSDVFLCSSDKDLCQLITDHILVINTHKDNLLIDRAKVKELFGVTPEKMVDYLAIVGDVSDNIPGLEGFGSKTAADLLSQFDSLDYLLEHPEVIKGKKKEVFIRDQEIALLSKRLATIDTEVVIPQSQDFFKLKEPQERELQKFFQEMHFLSLLKEREIPSNINQEKRKYTLVEDLQALKELVIRLSHKKEIGIHTVATDTHSLFATLLGISFSVEPHQAWYVPCNGKIEKTQVISIIQPLLENEEIGFCGHNIKYDKHVLLNEGIVLKKILFDTMIASHLLAPQKMHDFLDELVLLKMGTAKTSLESLLGKGKNQIILNEVPLNQLYQYGCENVDYIWQLMALFKQEMENEELSDLFYHIELPLISVLFHLERSGIYLDREALKNMSYDLMQKIHSLELEIFKLAGQHFNLNSPKQLSTILFDTLGISPPKKTNTGFSTSAPVLESLIEAHPIIKLLLTYRSLEKLRSTYVDTLPLQIVPSTGRVHATFNQTATATGRLSCQNPNLQNIPIRSEEGRKIRTAFKPEKPDWSYLSADYSQMELRLLAHFSEDPTLIKAFEKGEDIHAFTASLIFNIPLDEVTPHMRHQAKAVNFGIVYGQQAFGLSQGLDISFNEAATFIDTYFQRYKKVKEFFEFCKESVKKRGYSLTLFGRKRPIPDINNKNPVIRAQAERLAMNTPLQGSAADLIKIAMIKIDDLLEKNKELGIMNLQIHDELLFEVPDDKKEPLTHHVKNIMEGVFALKVPLVVDISIGKNWGEC